MPIKQTFNKKIGAWVKFKVTSKGSKILDVKQKKPKVPFKGITKK